MIKQAILIIAHNNEWILRELIKTLDSNYFDLYIHIDTKSSIKPESLTSLCKKSAIKVYQQINVRWADITQIECEMLLLKEAKKVANYKYYHLISGVDFPIKPVERIYSFFNRSSKEFIHFESNHLDSQKLDWIKYYHLFRKYERNNIIFKGLEYISLNIQKILKINRIKNCNIQFMTGSNWFSITDQFATYVLNNYKKYISIFKNSRSSDEILMQTLLYNSKFYKANIYNQYNNVLSNMRLVDWKRGNPYVYTTKDLSELESSKCLFARKFDENVDKNVIIKLERRINNSNENRK